MPVSPRPAWRHLADPVADFSCDYFEQLGCVPFAAWVTA
jgi:hypothetical protein